MAYEKQKFIDKVTVLSAKQLDHIEDGIYKNSLVADRVRNIDWIPSKTMEPVIILEETKVSAGFNYDITYAKLEGQEEVAVLCDGRLFICVPEFGYAEGDGHYVYLGNKSLVSSSEPDTGETFLVWLCFKGVNYSSLKFATSGEHTMSITGYVYEYNKMPEEYFPESFTDIILKDSKTGTNYKLVVTNGQLMIEEV